MTLDQPSKSNVPLTIEPPDARTIDQARLEIGAAIRTPMVRIEAPGGVDLRLKLECLQPIGSFKLRGALAALGRCPADALKAGVWTTSAGNMAQGVAFAARSLGVAATVVMPDHAPTAKRLATEALGAKVVAVPFDAWWQAMESHRHPAATGHFVHPVCDAGVVAGNATLGLEILEDCPQAEAVIVPFGGGGLACGIAAAFAAHDAHIPVFAAEVATAAPFAAALEAGSPQPIDYQASFVDGIGGRGVLAPMWPMAKRLLAGSLVVDLEEIADAIRRLVRHARVVAEGAGAASVAAAIAGRREGALGTGPIVCVVSGGNIDPPVLAAILEGRTPVPGST